MPEFTGTKDLRAYLRILWRWKLLILGLILLPPVGAYLLERGKPKTYKSSTLVGINGATVNSSATSGGGSFSTDNVTAIASLVTTTPVAQIAASLLHPPANPGDIAGEVSAVGDASTNFLTITAVDRSPIRAAAIANAFAHAISLNRQNAATSQLNASIRAIQTQIARLHRNDANLRAQFQQQLTTLQASQATQGSAAAILQAAGPGALVGPNPRRAAEIGLVIGLLLALGAVALAESADRRLRTPDDLERMTELPLLTSIPPSAFSGELETTKIDAEAFHMLRTALMYYNTERRLESVLVTSPGEKNGKTTVATRLALATAGAGQTVILVDGDLRRAQVSAKFGIRTKAGLGAVLAGDLPLADALVDYPVTGPGSGRLIVLPAGPPPPNPSALIGSPAMQHLVHELESQSDLVIVDSPAALAVSDALPLMRLVTGVILVARMNQTSRDPIRRLQQMIASAGGTLLGLVATGVSSGPWYGEYSLKYYTENGGHDASRHGLLRRRHPPATPEVVLASPSEPPSVEAESKD
jgi:capsular exopolysaccharide synthesis family protein